MAQIVKEIVNDIGDAWYTINKVDGTIRIQLGANTSASLFSCPVII